MATKKLIVCPGHTIVVNDPETNNPRYLAAGESWDFNDDDETAQYKAAGVLADPPAAAPAPAEPAAS